MGVQHQTLQTRNSWGHNYGQKGSYSNKWGLARSQPQIRQALILYSRTHVLEYKKFWSSHCNPIVHISTMVYKLGSETEMRVLA